MGLLYGSGKPLRTPGWVTGSETPTQRDKRLRDVNDALEKNRKREEERRNRELFTQLERQAELKLSPPSPPRGLDTPTPLLDDTPVDDGIVRPGSQSSFEGWLNQRLESYEETFGMTPLFGSQAYESAETAAREDWRNEQAHVPDDLVADREVGLFLRSRELREGVERPPPEVDAKWDILLDSIAADAGVPREAVDRGVVGFQRDIRADNPGISDQALREQVYRTLRFQEHLSDVLDEWGWPRGEDIPPPPSAIDEALQREAEENGSFFKDLPDRPGLIESVSKVFLTKWIPTAALKSLPPTAIPLALSGKLDQDFLSLDDVHVIGQETFADPLAGLALRGEIPVLQQAPGGVGIGVIETGAGLGGVARAGELGFGEVTGVETTAVSDALRSQLAEDIVSEIISPEFVLIGLPFAGVGTRGLTGAAKITRIAANLTVGTDVGLARGFPLLRPSSARAVLRGLTAVARSPLALRRLPQAVRDNPVFQRGLEGIREARASRVGRGLPHDEFVRVIGADDPVRFRRVTKDLIQGNPSTTDNLPLRQAIETDLTSGRSMEEIIETGLSPRTAGEVPAEATGELATFWRGEEGGGELRFLTQREALTEQRLFDRWVEGKIVSPNDLRRVVRNAELLDPDLIELASSGELFQLLQGNRLETALGGRGLGRMKKAELVGLIDQAGLDIAKTAPRNRMLAELNKTRDSLKSIKGTIETRSFEFLSEGDVARMAQLTAEGELAPGKLPTQLIKGPKAARMRNLQADMFDPRVPLGTRQERIDKYVSEMENIVAAAEEGSVTRVSATVDAKTNRWAWDTQFGVKPWATAQKDLRENLRVLTSLHLGTPEERLAALVPERARAINEGIDDFLFAFRDRLGKTELARFRARLQTMMLDSEAGVEILDAGRQLEAMFQIAQVPQGAKNLAYDALRVLTTHGATPSAQEITAMRRVLEPVLGQGTTSQLLNARKLTTKGGELVLNTLGLPRALMASADISALVRQGAVLGARQPVDWVKMAGRSIRAFWQPEYADALRDSITHRGVIRLQDGQTVDMYDFSKRIGAFFGSDVGEQGLLFSEETWMTRFASKWGWHLPKDAAGRFSLNPAKWEKVPFPVPLAQGERSYVLGLDKMRADYLDNMIGKLVRRGMANGREATIPDFEQLALFVNNASGRGNLPELLKNYHPLINALLFAPRLAISRFALIGDVVRHTIRGGPMRRVVWETLAADAATAAAGLYMINLGLDKVGVDANINFLQPLKKSKDGTWFTNSEFLKLTIGEETFIDFSASMLPVQRLLLGLGVAAYQGDAEMAVELADRFRRSKFAPVPSGVEDVVTGEDFIGGKIEMSLDDLLGDVILSRTIPLSWQSPFEAVAASRGVIDIDIGPAILDLSNWKLSKDEAIQAGAALSAEIIGGGVVSFFQPGRRLAELDEENLQRMLDRGEIKETEGQEIGSMDDLNLIQLQQVEDARGSVEKELEEKVEEQGLWRDSEWIKKKKDEEEFHESLRVDGHYTNPETGKREKLWNWTPSDLADQLRTGRIDGSAYRFATAGNIKDEINVQRALFGFSGEEEEIEDIENPVDKLLAEYWEIEPLITPGGEYDFETFEAERTAKEDEISKLVGDPVKVQEYFASFRIEDETQLELRDAKEDREVFEATPAYMGGISEASTNQLLDRTKEYLLGVGSRWGTARYIQWLYYQDEKYQTNEWAVAYWVALGERDMVANPDRAAMVFGGRLSDGTSVPPNPELVMFYPSIFQSLTDSGKQRFITRWQGGFLSDELEKALTEEGKFSFQNESELFRPEALTTPLFAR